MVKVEREGKREIFRQIKEARHCLFPSALQVGRADRARRTDAKLSLVTHSAPLPQGFEQTAVLDEGEAADAAACANGLRAHWRRRNDTGLYHTIGTVSEEDARDGVDRYCALAASSNAILREGFGNLLERVRQAIESLKNEPVRFHPRFGLPGIMVYLAPRRPAIVVGNRPHVDLQYRLLDWDDDFEPKDENLLSFTLPLALPREGAGLRTWPEFRNGVPNGVALTSRNATFTAYEAGIMLCHDGRTPHHGVGMRTDGQREEARITLQGFGARVHGEWLLYW